MHDAKRRTYATSAQIARLLVIAASIFDKVSGFRAHVGGDVSVFVELPEGEPPEGQGNEWDTVLSEPRG